MKNKGKFTGILMVILIAGSTNINAQRGMRGIMDSTRMQRPGREFVHAPMHGNIQGRGFATGPVHGNRNGMSPMQAGMMGRGFRHEGRVGVPPAPGAGRLENLPSLNDKQKKEITDLRQKQIAEMKKIREDLMARMQVLRDEHRKNILSILTDEQKKQVEAGVGNPKVNSSR